MVRTQTSKICQSSGLMIMLVLIVTGCSTGISHFERRVSASNYFEQYQVLPDHKYYYFGHPHSPDAVVGIRNGWTFQTTSWQTMAPDERKLRDLVERMHNTPGSEYNIEPNGAYISNDQGETIGVWYSMWVLPILRFEDEKTFTISDPVPTFPRTNRDPEGGLLRIFQ